MSRRAAQHSHRVVLPLPKPLPMLSGLSFCVILLNPTQFFSSWASQGRFLAGTGLAVFQVCTAWRALLFWRPGMSLRLPQPIKDVYPDVVDRYKRLVCKDTRHDTLLSWPESEQDTASLINWLGRTFFGDYNYFWEYKNIGRQCITISREALLQHHHDWRAAETAGLYVYQKTDRRTLEPSYFTITFKTRKTAELQQLQQTPGHVDLHAFLCHWAYGPKRSAQVCCHFICEHPFCLNIRHIRCVPACRPACHGARTASRN